MARLKTNPITLSDLSEFVSTVSEFGFEMQVLNVLRSHGFEFEHSGTYEDPSTKKPRQFDIRATGISENRIVRLAIECKRLREHFPLLISCIPRTENESFHDVIVSVDPHEFSLAPAGADRTVGARILEPQAKTLRLRGMNSVYEVGELVGKSSDQVGRDTNGIIVANDSDVYSKWAQAVSSAAELVDRANSDRERVENVEMCFSFICPVLVVPDGTLWQCDYDAKGNQVSDPRQQQRVSFFIDKTYQYENSLNWMEYRMSHIEFLTVTGLKSFLLNIINNMEKVFPTEVMMNQIADYLQHGTESDDVI